MGILETNYNLLLLAIILNIVTTLIFAMETLNCL